MIHPFILFTNFFNKSKSIKSIKLNVYLSFYLVTKKPAYLIMPNNMITLAYTRSTRFLTRTNLRTRIKLI